MDNTTIQKFLDEHDYDIRKTHNGRWIDQKCTMDVVCLVSDCIVEYTSNREDKRFTVNDIWYSDYTVENVQQIFSKPNPTQKASNEYDKYFGQPIKLLDAAGVIHGEKSGRGYTYSIVNQELLEYISFRERNSFNFLCLYIEKVLKDSGLYRIFEYFFRLQDKNSFRELKDAYTQFTINYTPINGAKRTVYYTTKYERSSKNREAAIRIHGTKCMICGFDFGQKYGELGKGYIEVHHIKPLATLEQEVVVNPETDLICVCANCHRMLHRFKNYIVTVEELKCIIEDNQEEV